MSSLERRKHYIHKYNKYNKKIMIKKFNDFINESHSNVSNNKKGYKPKDKKE